MGEFKVKNIFENKSIEDWTSEDMCFYYKKTYEIAFFVHTRRPFGQIRIVINNANIAKLHNLEGNKNIHPNKLFKQYINWSLIDKGKKRIWLLKNESFMCDFLDERATEEALNDTSEANYKQQVQSSLDFINQGDNDE